MEPETLASKSIMIVAGEASGDMHGAGLVRAMRKRDQTLEFFGTGGFELSRAGVEILCDIKKISVMGLSEILSNFKEIISTYLLLKRTLKKRKPSLLILIDFGEFNLRLAKQANQLNIPVFYYITPKVWVWRKKRARKLAEYVDRAAVILPFEEAFLQKSGVRATYVGNPVLDAVQVSLTKREFCSKYGLDENKAIVGILPGSRKKEVSQLLPVFLESARRMQKKYSRELTFVLPLASTLTRDDLNKFGLERYQSELDIHVLSEDRYELMSACDGVIAASGTATLELAVLDVPMVVAYKFSPLSYYIGKLFIHIPFFSLVNIIAGKNLVTELLQEQVHAAAVELELARILFDEDVRAHMKRELLQVREKIGSSGASANAAKLAFETMK